MFYDISHNINATDKFSSLATCLPKASNAKFNDVLILPGASLISVKKETYNLNILLLYRKQSMSQHDFFYTIQHVLSYSNDNIHIILGDFNYDYFKHKEAIHSCLSEYIMIVDQPTHLSGSLLDHVYIRKDFHEQLRLTQCVLKRIFFSDHDAVKFQLLC